MFYTNKSRPLILNSSIVEWDIKSANTSLMRYYKLKPDKLITKLEAMRKEERERAVGILQLKNPDFAKLLESSFNNIIKEFISINNIKEDDIVSVKRDAVFVKNHDIRTSTLGDSVIFIPKNTYNHVILIPQYEFYIGRNKIDVKGISDDSLELHRNGILQYIRDISTDGHNAILVNKYLKEFVNSYKKRELELDYYREFNSDSLYRINIMGYESTMDNITIDDLLDLDIRYNYEKIILPSVQLFLR